MTFCCNSSFKMHDLVCAAIVPDSRSASSIPDECSFCFHFFLSLTQYKTCALSRGLVFNPIRCVLHYEVDASSIL